MTYLMNNATGDWLGGTGIDSGNRAMLVRGKGREEREKERDRDRQTD